ncbi:MAG: AAA family ATPase [gamma proteobacterium symbiont of Bathyaustriella thionipta]|nr:AAA family ATPase [gamma proteobacterium symbiont of Bathyaustriella thionipta]MCU7948876.1 AAA family ATPase [gamma proteobacterium symbiont of Bathyaustriella thionipta]MCU7952378.1 AAA family ATPase [gamma proteobacterium symbiont of Bathyaustriella thionipta]MCU7955333.1 AAA family ATPase [gamma proteobacterium symbiont of Bathyaustriella thionipta]MCU7966119.1 AAA family ATPase [gamma proteobacterium symbiont of Bathyaustriella thionipta]
MSLYQQITHARDCLRKKIIGQDALVNKLFIALLADGHLLVEGAPGLAKTRAIKELSDLIEADFHRVQFTPDLLPADLTGTEIYRPQDASFHFQKGPLFHNLLLADEINRAPAKVQSALLEAMAEQQITVGRETYQLPKLFMVMATQNPIEQEGTYPLPEAQLDRFLMHISIDYPHQDAEKAILELNRKEAQEELLNTSNYTGSESGEPVISQQVLFAARHEILNIHMSEEVEAYLLTIILATRDPSPYDEELANWVNYGVSPRATIALDRCARAHAWLAGKDYVAPSDIQAVASDIFRHRLLLSFEAEANGIDTDYFIARLLSYIAVP